MPVTQEMVHERIKRNTNRAYRLFAILGIAALISVTVGALTLGILPKLPPPQHYADQAITSAATPTKKVKARVAKGDLDVILERIQKLLGKDVYQESSSTSPFGTFTKFKLNQLNGKQAAQMQQLHSKRFSITQNYRYWPDENIPIGHFTNPPYRMNLSVREVRPYQLVHSITVPWTIFSTITSMLIFVAFIDYIFNARSREEIMTNTWREMEEEQKKEANDTQE